MQGSGALSVPESFCLRPRMSEGECFFLLLFAFYHPRRGISLLPWARGRKKTAKERKKKHKKHNDPDLFSHPNFLNESKKFIPFFQPSRPPPRRFAQHTHIFVNKQLREEKTNIATK